MKSDDWNIVRLPEHKYQMIIIQQKNTRPGWCGDRADLLLDPGAGLKLLPIANIDEGEDKIIAIILKVLAVVSLGCNVSYQ